MDIVFLSFGWNSWISVASSTKMPRKSLQFCKQAASARLREEHQEEISENVLLSRSGLMGNAWVVFAVSSLAQPAQSAQQAELLSSPGGYGLDFHGEMPRA